MQITPDVGYWSRQLAIERMKAETLGAVYRVENDTPSFNAVVEALKGVKFSKDMLNHWKKKGESERGN